MCGAGRVWVQASNHRLGHLNHRGELGGKGSWSGSPVWVHRGLWTHCAGYTHPSPARTWGSTHSAAVQIRPLHLQQSHTWEPCCQSRSVSSACLCLCLVVCFCLSVFLFLFIRCVVCLCRWVYVCMSLFVCWKWPSPLCDCLISSWHALADYDKFWQTCATSNLFVYKLGLSLYLSVCLYICPYVYLLCVYVCMSVHVVCLSVCSCSECSGQVWFSVWRTAAQCSCPFGTVCLSHFHCFISYCRPPCRSCSFVCLFCAVFTFEHKKNRQAEKLVCHFSLPDVT